MPTLAVVFDFDGTLSDEEPVLPEIVRTRLGKNHVDMQAVMQEHVRSDVMRRCLS